MPATLSADPRLAHFAAKALVRQMKESKLSSIRVRIATITVAVLTLVLAGAAPVQAASLKNCNTSGATTPCFERVWADRDQVKMTFVDLNPQPSNAPTANFYVTAPQTRAPQGLVPFLHDHVIGDVPPQNHRYHGFFVLCSDQGISSGGCVPTMTLIPGLGTMPFAKTVNGHKLTSVDPIESPKNSALLTLFDTGGVFIATVKSRQEDESQ
jgi:hypothetical protein